MFVNFANDPKKKMTQSAPKAFGALCVVLAVGFLICFFVFFRDAASPVFQKENGFASAREGIFVINDKTLRVEVAKTEKERIQGLSGKNIIPRDGMFFIFDTDARHGIWMKDMHFAIDILWLGEDFQVIDLRENIFPNTYPEIFVPESPARYVLEIPSGILHRFGVQKGDSAFFRFGGE